MGSTSNYNLETWSSAEYGDTFGNYISGTSGATASNMTIIDAQMKANADNANARLSRSGGNMTGAINEALVSSMALAGTMNIGAAPGNYIIVTAGTGPITAFDTAPAGARRFMLFSVSATINYNASTMLIPGSEDLSVVSGDVLEWVTSGGGVWRCVNIERWNASDKRSDLFTNLMTYDDASQIGITLSDTTTLEQLIQALPSSSILIISPPTTATTNVSPADNRFGTLLLYKLFSSRMFALYSGVAIAGQSTGMLWYNSIYSYDGGASYVLGGWTRTFRKQLSGNASVTILTGNLSREQDISFSPNQFVNPPLIHLDLQTSYPAGKSVAIKPGSITVSGFTLIVAYYTTVSTDTSVSVKWTALDDV